MSEITPTRSVVLELKDELRAMREGYAFLDEKCLMLAAEILRELVRYQKLDAALQALDTASRDALKRAVGRHGLQGLQCYPAADLAPATLEIETRKLMRVSLQSADLSPGAPAAAAVNPSPEADDCRARYAELVRAAACLAAVRGNLERLHHEYRRTVRRTRALQDVLIPEISGTLYELEARLEELEQEDALWMRLNR
jgi:V/A-type H+-transporting ATPase subunit D